MIARARWLVAAFTATLAAPLPAAAAAAPLLQGADTLTLAAAVRTALDHDPAVAGAGANVDAATASLDAARSARLPTLSSSARAVRFAEPMLVAPIHAFDLSRVPDFDRTLLQGRIEMAYTVWDGGARGARIDGARAARSAGAAGRTTHVQEAVARVVEAYLAVLTGRDVLAAQDARMRELDAELDRVRRFLDEGTAPRLELLRAQAERSAAAAEETAARARLERAEFRLASLLERPPAEVAETVLADVAPVDADSRLPPSPAVDDRMDDHPAVAAARSRLETARAALHQARAAWFPRLHATGAYLQYAGASADATGEWQAGLQLEYPLFTGGARAARIRRSDAEVRTAEAELRRVGREVELAEDAARSAEREALARAASLADAVERFEELARVEALALEEGVGVQRDFLRAQAGLLEARARLAEARRAAVLARTHVARALGLLTPEWITRTLEPAS